MPFAPQPTAGLRREHLFRRLLGKDLPGPLDLAVADRHTGLGNVQEGHALGERPAFGDNALVGLRGNVALHPKLMLFAFVAVSYSAPPRDSVSPGYGARIPATTAYARGSGNDSILGGPGGEWSRGAGEKTVAGAAVFRFDRSRAW